MTTMSLLSPRPTVLVVDDTPANLSLLASLLQSEYRVLLANNGHKALALAQAETPDLGAARCNDAGHGRFTRCAAA